MAENNGIFNDEFHGVGGCYEINADGKRVPVATVTDAAVAPADAAPATNTRKVKLATADAAASTSKGA